MLTVLAPAKLNLTLEVLAKRSDGFHEIRSVIQTINLCDSLHFQLSDEIEVKCNVPDWVPEESLVPRAASLLRQATGCSKGATIEVEKRIPLLSGLGGDSSDAAATLRGLSRLWGLSLSQEKLLELATELGSDVSFFLCDGTALVEGRGEVVTPLPPLSPMWAVLMMPPVPRTKGKTGQLYARLNPSHYTKGLSTKGLVAWLTEHREIMPSMFFNVFDSIAADSFSGLGEYREQFLQTGATSVHLAGSGPALFTLVKDKAQAEKIHEQLKQQGLESYLAETSASIEWVE